MRPQIQISRTRHNYSGADNFDSYRLNEYRFVDVVGLCWRCRTCVVCAGVLAVVCVLRSVLVIAREGKQVTNLLKFIAIDRKSVV
jgi:hypothetical protein